MSHYILISFLSRQQSFSSQMQRTMFVVVVLFLRSRNGTDNNFLVCECFLKFSPKEGQWWSWALVLNGAQWGPKKRKYTAAAVVIRGRWKLPPIQLQSWQTESYRSSLLCCKPSIRANHSYQMMSAKIRWNNTLLILVYTFEKEKKWQ